MNFLAPAIAVFLLSGALFPARAERVKVACVGDSITFGVGVKNPGRDSYPAKLGRLLGAGYEVKNFGASGTTLLRHGNNPYEQTAAFREATKFRPAIVVIALGTNDSKTRNWDGRAQEFRPDYEALISHFSRPSKGSKIFLALPPPAFRDNGDIRERILVRQRGIIREIARVRNLPVVDFEAPLRQRPDALADGIHPNEAGTTILAKSAARALRSPSGGGRPRRGRGHGTTRRRRRRGPRARSRRSAGSIQPAGGSRRS